MALDFCLVLLGPRGDSHRDGEKEYKIAKLVEGGGEMAHSRGREREKEFPKLVGSQLAFSSRSFRLRIRFFIRTSFSRQKFVPISFGGLWKLYQADTIAPFSMFSPVSLFLIGPPKKVNEEGSNEGQRHHFSPSRCGRPEISLPRSYREKRGLLRRLFSHRMFRIVNFPMDPPFPVIVRLPLRPPVESLAGWLSLSEPPR